MKGVLYGVYWRASYSYMEYIGGCSVWSILEGVLYGYGGVLDLEGVVYRYWGIDMGVILL